MIEGGGVQSEGELVKFLGRRSSHKINYVLEIDLQKEAGHSSTFWKKISHLQCCVDRSPKKKVSTLCSREKCGSSGQSRVAALLVMVSIDFGSSYSAGWPPLTDSITTSNERQYVLW